MSLSGVFAEAVALIGAAAIRWRRRQGTPQQQAVGAAPAIPAAHTQSPGIGAGIVIIRCLHGLEGGA